MSLLDRMRGDHHLDKNTSFRITQEGKEKLLQYGGDPKSRLLQGLESGGSGSISDIAQISGLSRGLVERLLPSLVRGGYVQPITSAVMEDSD